jgi:hypothetical protein
MPPLVVLYLYNYVVDFKYAVQYGGVLVSVYYREIRILSLEFYIATERCCVYCRQLQALLTTATVNTNTTINNQ